MPLPQGDKVRVVAAVLNGAEWGRHGKWSGFSRYPGPEPGGTGRFAWRAVQDRAEQLAGVITEEIRPRLELNGWAA
jgi:hypothetical protein